MEDGLEHSADIAVPVSSRRNFIRTAAVTGGAGLLSEGLEPIRAQENAKKVPLLVLPPAAKDLSPFTVHVPQSALDDLKRRLAAVRWPDKGSATDWSQGVPLPRAQEFIEYWRTRYNWRRAESSLNALPQFARKLTVSGSTSFTSDRSTRMLCRLSLRTDGPDRLSSFCRSSHRS